MGTPMRKPMGRQMNGPMKDGVEHVELAPGFTVSRVATGLWQIADMERAGEGLDAERTSAALGPYLDAGFTGFAVSDRHGSTEMIAGRFRADHPRGAETQILTTWVPQSGPITFETVRAAVQGSLDRMQAARIDLLQFDAWSYANPAWLDCLFWLQDLKEEGLIGHLGLTNFDTAHLRIAVTSGIDVVSNQVSYSLLDQRARIGMTDLCLEHDIKLLVFGTLAGGLFTERWLGAPRPALEDLNTPSEAKYWRLIEAVGGWNAVQHVLECVASVARKRNASIANVVCRYMLDLPAVGAVIVGARAGQKDHIKDNSRVFGLSLTRKDRSDIEYALTRLDPLPGDCGDEYRRPPFLTPTGDPGCNLDAFPRPYGTKRGADRRGRVLTGTAWEETAGFSRAIRRRDYIWISGTTSTHRSRVIGGKDAEAQAHFAIDKIEGTLQSLGSCLEDVVRTRVYIRDKSIWEAVARVHGERFGHILPASTMVQTGLIGGEYMVEIEAEAAVG
jgi:aryl-alcohol dehydrogenase-like predicted oxidoreductase/enamine deaminase RidA (YjgF/YER057c/UK114 family)